MSAPAKPLPSTAARLPRLIALWLIAIAMAAPFLWMVLTSLKPLQEIESANPIPKDWRPDNYTRVFEQIPYARYYFNSILVAVWVTTLQVFTSALAAFAFSRLVWPGRDSVFKLYLATLMIPGVVTMIPNYTLLVKLRLLDSYTGLILPAAFTAFGTFLLRQFMLQIPRSLDEAAEIDGASRWQTFWLVVLPLCRPSLVTLGVFSFLGTYGSFFWPLVLIKTEGLRTLPIGMLFFDSAYGKQTNLIMAASLMSVLPLIIAFLCTQRLVVQGIQAGAVKG